MIVLLSPGRCNICAADRLCESTSGVPHLETVQHKNLHYGGDKSVSATILHST